MTTRASPNQMWLGPNERMGSGGNPKENRMSTSPGLGRSIDPLGRIVIPMEIRRTLGLHPGSTLAVSVDTDRVVLRPLQITDDPLPCLFCGEDDPSVLRSYRNRSVCDRCRANLSRIHHSQQADPPNRPMPAIVRSPKPPRPTSRSEPASPSTRTSTRPTAPRVTRTRGATCISTRRATGGAEHANPPPEAESQPPSHDRLPGAPHRSINRYPLSPCR